MDKAKTAITAGIVAGVITITGFISSVRIIKEGEVGIETRAGAYVRTVEDSGIHFVTPFFIGGMKKLDVKEKTKSFDYTSENSAATSDEQDLLGSVTIHYHLNKDQAEYVYKNIGTDYEDKLINNGDTIDQIFKSETTKYSSNDVLKHRDEIAAKTKERLNETLNEKGITVTAFNISQFGFSDQYNQAIEEKQVAEQKKQTAEKNKEIAIIEAEKQKETAIIEAEAKVITAEKEAEANEKLNSSITDKIIELQKIKKELEAIQKWDGKLPTVTSDNIPFINIDANKTLTK